MHPANGLVSLVLLEGRQRPRLQREKKDFTSEATIGKRDRTIYGTKIEMIKR